MPHTLCVVEASEYNKYRVAPPAASVTLRQFAIAVHEADGVPASCVSLQDRFGLDVNVLLLAAYLGTVLRQMPTAEQLRSARALVDGWHGEVVRPLRGVRRMLSRLHNELKLPVYCLLDNDPWGYYIYSVIKQGSINLAYESQRMAIPDVRYLGLRSKDLERCQLSDSVKITLNDNDKKRAKQIANYPWFAKKRDWQREIEKMLKNDFKLEVESLISKDISYVTEEYVPARLRDQDWLD